MATCFTPRIFLQHLPCSPHSITRVNEQSLKPNRSPENDNIAFFLLLLLLNGLNNSCQAFTGVFSASDWDPSLNIFTKIIQTAHIVLISWKYISSTILAIGEHKQGHTPSEFWLCCIVSYTTYFKASHSSFLNPPSTTSCKPRPQTHCALGALVMSWQGQGM